MLVGSLFKNEWFTDPIQGGAWKQGAAQRKESSACGFDRIAGIDKYIDQGLCEGHQFKIENNACCTNSNNRSWYTDCLKAGQWVGSIIETRNNYQTWEASKQFVIEGIFARLCNNNCRFLHSIISQILSASISGGGYRRRRLMVPYDFFTPPPTFVGSCLKW